MGTFDDIWNFIGGSKSTSATNTTKKEISTQTQDTQQKQAQSTNSTATLLDSGTLATLRSLVPGLASAVGAGGTNPDVSTIRDLSTTLAGRANADLSPVIAASEAEARRQFGVGEGAQISQLQQQIGSKGNSFSQILQSQGNADLSTQLAKIFADTTMAGRQMGDTELSSAISGVSNAGQLGIASTEAPVSNLVGVLNILKGSTVNQSTDVLSTLSQLISSLGEVDTTGSSFTKTKDSPGLIQTLGELGKV